MGVGRWQSGVVNWKCRRALPIAAALLITLYGGLLRLDAFAGKYPKLDHPGWARVLVDHIAPLGAALRPSSIVWKPEAQPYIGGDPITYLSYARQMRGFFDADVREPVFRALTRGWLWALDDQDAAVSFASLTGSTLVIFATYLLGSVLWSTGAGLLAALLVAIEHEMVTWGPDGWRDDTFTATVIFAAWALIRLYKRPSTRNAMLAGGVCGIACLTRITALSFVVPGLAWLVVAAAPEGFAASAQYPARKQRVKLVAIAIGVCVLVLGPYLLNCAVAFGDPLYAINYHTSYYRHAEGEKVADSISAAEYVTKKFSERPIGTLDTAFEGLFLQPFIEKWRGFAPWFGRFESLLRALALLGLAVCALFSSGRLMLLLLVTSLIPYMVTWNIGGGSEWRFTMHAYPFYLVALCCVLVDAIPAARWLRAHGTTIGRAEAIRFGVAAAAIALIAALGTTAYFFLPWLVVREAIARGDSTSIETGRRDAVFYRDGWTPVHREGIVVRVSRDRGVVHIPMVAGRNYDIVLRMDPVDPSAAQRVSVLFNGHFVSRPNLLWDPTRVGSYRIPIRADMVMAANRLTIIAEPLVTAGSAGPRFAWLDAGERIGVRFWYVRVLPLPD